MPCAMAVVFELFGTRFTCDSGNATASTVYGSKLNPIKRKKKNKIWWKSSAQNRTQITLNRWEKADFCWCVHMNVRIIFLLFIRSESNYSFVWFALVFMCNTMRDENCISILFDSMFMAHFSRRWHIQSKWEKWWIESILFRSTTTKKCVWRNSENI